MEDGVNITYCTCEELLDGMVDLQTLMVLLKHTDQPGGYTKAQADLKMDWDAFNSMMLYLEEQQAVALTLTNDPNL